MLRESIAREYSFSIRKMVITRGAKAGALELRDIFGKDNLFGMQNHFLDDEASYSGSQEDRRASVAM